MQLKTANQMVPYTLLSLVQQNQANDPINIVSTGTMSVKPDILLNKSDAQWYQTFKTINDSALRMFSEDIINSDHLSCYE